MFIYLLPPSESKNTGGIDTISARTFDFALPIEIALQATQKDLKCKGARYEEGMELNKALAIAYQTPTPSRALGTPYQGTRSDGGSPGGLEALPAIHRYSGVMYKAIGYDTMDDDARDYFDTQVLILSGMYGLLRPQDTIGNYKLPIDTKGLRKWRGERITHMLIETYADQDVTFVDLLSGAYQKMLDPKKIREAGIAYITAYFLKSDGSKYTHGVKKVKGERLRNLMINQTKKISDLGGECDNDHMNIYV